MTTLLLSIYQVGLILFGSLYLAIRLIRGRRLPGWRERLALYTPDERRGLALLRGPIWIHLVSVGEVLAAEPLVEEMRLRFPERDWVVTTVTPTGRILAQRLIREGRDALLYLPWDLAPLVRRAIRLFRPCLFLSFETELWPVLFHELGRMQVPIAVVNGRISPSAYRRYLWVRPWMERALAPVGLFLTQSPQDAGRFAAIGAAKDRIVVTGNLKWDLKMKEASDGLEPSRLRKLLGLSSDSMLWTAGSTHRGEESLLLQAYRSLKAQFPFLRLLVAPRHPERVAEVEQEIWAAGMRAVRRTQLPGMREFENERMREKQEDVTHPRTTHSPIPEISDPVVVLDTLGELALFYPASDLVFVGGSLVPQGGHNLVEPALSGRPILSGPYVGNFSAIAEQLAQAGGLLLVQSVREVEEAMRRLLQDAEAGRRMGMKARQVVEQHRGATKRTADRIALRWCERLRLEDAAPRPSGQALGHPTTSNEAQRASANPMGSSFQKRPAEGRPWREWGHA